MDRPSLGDVELDLLRYVADHAPATAREIAEGYGASRRLAPTTIFTMLERLRKKGYLSRKKREGVYFYSPGVSSEEALQGVVRQFIEKTLGGSVSPVFAYLAHGDRLNDQEIDELQRLVDELKSQREEKRP